MTLSDQEFEARWGPLESKLRAVEDRYRSERIRKNGQPHPVGSARTELDEALSETCELYIEAAPGPRSRMRDFFEWSYVLPRFLLDLNGMPIQVANESPVDRVLRHVLAAASLENCKTDFRDTFMFLGRIHEAAASRGLNPKPFFEEAAAWSSADEDCRTMRIIFARF